MHTHTCVCVCVCVVCSVAALLALHPHGSHADGSAEWPLFTARSPACSSGHAHACHARAIAPPRSSSRVGPQSSPPRRSTPRANPPRRAAAAMRQDVRPGVRRVARAHSHARISHARIPHALTLTAACHACVCTYLHCGRPAAVPNAAAPRGATCLPHTAAHVAPVGECGRPRPRAVRGRLLLPGAHCVLPVFVT